ncbi:MAG: undecaprenyldiphospho-muramoylpentapeptide beta-N-acetylglucosaminyltransferase [Verrucomicrobiia bacterium]|jgi:UDP-N-acetylglucosamine--N-acetylmuramyl-(pentapeptide) pyrophosphoryl-undecaprenol N-acetylglucosamine transferase
MTKLHPHIAIACGGTGGHIFPGLAVADRLAQSGCDVTVIISNKPVDKLACEDITGVSVIELPAVAKRQGNLKEFISALWKSIQLCRAYFKSKKPNAIFATGGFVSAAPVIVGKLMGAKIFIHESNTIPGKANRLFSFVADEVFVGFKCSAQFFPKKKVRVTGTPVRPEFLNIDRTLCCRSLGLDEKRPTLLVAGGSQGAHPINELFINSMSLLKQKLSGWQIIHITGREDYESVNKAYQENGLNARVYSFYRRMDELLGAATVVVSRAGASFLAELSAARVPPLLIPYPYAADNHQFYNSLVFVKAGAGRMLEQKNATPELLVGMILQLSQESHIRAQNIETLARLNSINAAETIANLIIEKIKTTFGDAILLEPRQSIWAQTKQNISIKPQQTEPIFVK